MYELYVKIKTFFFKQKIKRENDPLMKGIVLKARLYAFNVESLTRRKYDGKPYSFHTYMVYQYAKKYIDLIPVIERDSTLGACFTHDLIEDCGVTFNDVRKATNVKIASLTSALTTLVHGHTRRDRAPKSYYRRILKEKNADFIKICDRLANIKNSVNTNSTMLVAYRNENNKFRKNLYDEKYDIMFQEMDKLLKIK